MDNKNRVFAPGCALYLYKPELIGRLSGFLKDKFGVTQTYDTCCNHEPRGLDEGTEIINVCSGCDKRYDTLYENVSTVSLWTLLADSDFPFPDYGGTKITVHDACPTRHKTNVHAAIRKLLERMNLTVIEAEQSGVNAFCCGDSFYKKIPKDELLVQMKRRADSLPVQDVAVYCVSCIKSMANGGKTPRYIVDLLFNEKTEPRETDPDKWHESISEFAEKH